MTQISQITAIVVLAIVTGVSCLRDARLEVIPEIVERGSEATLRCHYVLENTPLYSLKWYRGKHEFYRYSPSETPNTKVFGVSGIQVDVTKSNESQVTIRNVEFEVAGNFSCEVTADAPSFSTEIGWKKLTVVSLPTGSPVITTERERYDPGDILRANCTSLPSKPPAIIYFTLNNQPVGQIVPSSERMAHRQHKSDQHAKDVHQEEKRKHWEWNDLQWNEISLTLQSSHYVNGQLSLRCIVKIPDIYNATSEVQLGAGLREPVPERVTSENSAVMTSSLSSLALLFLSLSYTLGR